MCINLFFYPGSWIFFYPNFFLCLDPGSFLRLFSFDHFYQYSTFYPFIIFSLK